MKVKLTGATFVALIIYLITALIGLIQFNPLSQVLMLGLKFALAGFVFAFLLTFLMEFMNSLSKKQPTNNQNINKSETQPKGKANNEYNKNNIKQDEKQNNDFNQNAANNEQTDINNDTVETDFNDDFSEMEPPVVEYKQNN